MEKVNDTINLGGLKLQKSGEITVRFCLRDDCGVLVSGWIVMSNASEGLDGLVYLRKDGVSVEVRPLEDFIPNFPFQHKLSATFDGHLDGLESLETIACFDKNEAYHRFEDIVEKVLRETIRREHMIFGLDFVDDDDFKSSPVNQPNLINEGDIIRVRMRDENTCLGFKSGLWRYFYACSVMDTYIHGYELLDPTIKNPKEDSFIITFGFANAVKGYSFKDCIIETVPKEYVEGYKVSFRPEMVL